MPRVHYFATSNTSQVEMWVGTLRALQFEGYSGHREVTVLSDGAEIIKRLAKALRNPDRSEPRLGLRFAMGPDTRLSA